MATTRPYRTSAHVNAALTSITWAATLIVLGGLLGEPASAEPTWQVFQLTAGVSPDRAPAVSGTTYVWQRGNFGATRVFKWSEGEAVPTEISVNTKEIAPRIHNGRVVWYSNAIGSDYELVQWDGGVLSGLTSNTNDDTLCDIGDTGIVWLLNTSNLIYDDGLNQHTITAGSGVDQNPKVMGGWVVWDAGAADREVYLWESGNITQITNNGFDDTVPETDGSTIVWQANSGPGDTGEIMRWRPSDGTKAVTLNNEFDAQPDVSGDVIVFIRHDGNDNEIIMRYFGVEYQITDNAYDDFEPAVDGSRIVWQAADNGTPHIFYAILDGLNGGDLPGACCLGLDCAVLTEGQCLDEGGSFGGGETFCTIDSCGVEPAPGWSTYQGNAQRTGRTSVIIPNPPSLVWDLFIGTTSGPGIAPTLGPDGVVYAQGAAGLAAIEPDGSLRWTNGTLSGSAPLTTRLDGISYGRGKLDPLTGAVYCTNIGGNWAAAVDQDGAVYMPIENGPIWGLRKFDPACNVLWTTTVDGEGPVSHVAFGHNGDAYVSGEFGFLAVDQATGAIEWTLSTPGRAGAPAVAADGTIYFQHAPNILVAYDTDGTLKWDLELTGLQEVNAAVSPAVGSDGTIFVVMPSPVPTLVAVSPTGSELWRVSEPGSNPKPPVVDGDGTVLFTVEGSTVIGVSGFDGSEQWRLDLGPGDYADAPPAVAGDGTLYVSTHNGFLLAFGHASSCPPYSAVSPPFAYRKVFETGDTLSGYVVEEIQDLEILHDGRASFTAFVPATQTLGAFTEATGGGFDAIVRGEFIGPYEIDMVSQPRHDDAGNRYLSAYVVNVGPAVFVNDSLYVAEASSGAAAQVLLNTLDWRYVDHDEAGRILVLGKHQSSDPTTLYLIDTSNASILALLAIDDVVDGFQIDSLDPDPVDGFADDGVPVLQVSNGQFAIVTPTLALVRTGDTVDGRYVASPRLPRRNAGGDMYYLDSDDGEVFSRNSLGADSYERGPGETIAGQPILEIVQYALNNSRDLAFVARTLGSDGVFYNNKPVAVTSITEIAGLPIDGIGRLSINFLPVSINDAAQVAFVASLQGEGESLFVATPEADMDDSDGDGICALVDNCVDNHNPGQDDADGDTQGDTCDVCPFDGQNDVDGDELCANVDNCPLIANVLQDDGDGDGVGDACDPCPLDNPDDPDLDTICTVNDNCPQASNATQSDLDMNGVGDACEAPREALHPHDRLKNRYVSFAPASGSTPTAYRIRKTNIPTGSGWVGAPNPAGLARVVGAPVTRIWSEPVLHVGDCMVAPISSYEIQATTDGGTVFTAPLTVSTIAQPAPKFWGDTVGMFTAGEWTTPNGVVNANDFVAALQGFQVLPSAPHVSVTDVQSGSASDPCLNRVTNFADVFLLIKAFQGETYPFTTDPAACPSCP